MDNKENILNKKIFSEKNNIEKNQENFIDTTALQNKKIDDLKLELLQNQKKIHDIELRKLANIENIKKNTKEKIKKIEITEIERFLKTIIPVIDALEDILTSSNILDIKDSPLIKGIELTLQSLLNILYKLGVKIEGQENEIFNPNIHTLFSIKSSETISPNHIISTNKKGFTFHKILLRKAIVTIAKN